ncbi:MAG: STAS domain-containing protein [Melioribacter sp.]|uniref:STAS domain-containing protein n=1 Tax=Melioribacter sp. TaxID=2052167 RepID=UPI003BB9F7DD
MATNKNTSAYINNVLTTDIEKITDIAEKHFKNIPNERTFDLLSEDEFRDQVLKFLRIIAKYSPEIEKRQFYIELSADVVDFLKQFNSERSRQGFNANETVYFILSLKDILTDYLFEQKDIEKDKLASAVKIVSALVNKLAAEAYELYTKSREDVINKQARQILDMATPIIQIWESIVAVPLIGTLDSARTQIVMEKLLEKIVATKSKVAIIDITGVPTVDTRVAQHIMKTVQAIKLLGADCVITGISAAIAQTMVQMGVEFGGIHTRALMSDGIRYALNLIRKSSDNKVEMQ